MRVNGTHTRSIWLERDGGTVGVIDQIALPHELRTAQLRTLADAVCAIREMRIRGAPLIGATAAYGMALAAREAAADSDLQHAAAQLLATRPTAVNLRWAVERMLRELTQVAERERAAAAYALADTICDEDVAINQSIGEHGVKLLEEVARRNPDRPLQVMTHCNAGWLATVDWGTATASIYRAHRDGLPLHVWVAETRPRLQGALTAWELTQEGVPHTIVTDSAAGHLLQRGHVDLVITGTDRVAANGDAANKIGTYLKALAAREHDVPFYIAAPSPSIDWTVTHGDDIPIEERDARELTTLRGRNAEGGCAELMVYPAGARALNIGFDVTPARLITAFITDHGVVPPAELSRLPH